MASLLRSFMPVPSSKIDDFDDEYSVEYSFAIEYKGPPVSYDIPQVVPVDVQRIPIAAVVSTASSLSNLSLPVIQPIVKSKKKSDRESKVSGTEGVRSFAPEEVLERDTPFVSDQEGVLDGSEHSSGTLGFSDSPNNESHEISGSSDIEDVKERARMGIIGDDDEDSIRDELEDYALEVSSQISIWEEMEEGEDDADEAFNQGNRTAVVTFCEPESSNGTSEFSYGDEPESIDVKPVARTDLKKGSCHRCLKGSRFMEKEVCIVCGAKYCCNCLLRAMGSMPEGRKCITCIGFSIREHKRGSLGKSSKALKKLLVEGQVKEIMRNEVTCEANQIPAKQIPATLVIINGRPLSLQELVQLQSCRNPPRKIRPGRYWYDRVSGYWGREGHQPCQIISPSMEIGGVMELKASNGNTNVVINGREITKKELIIFKTTGIHCEGNTHFWLSEDGSCSLEGQKNVMGMLWQRSTTKLACTALCLPLPPRICDEEGALDPVNHIDENILHKLLLVGCDQSGTSVNHIDENIVHKLLLVGCDQSGTSTIFKQAKILYKVPFSEDELESVKLLIQTNLYRYIGILLEARDRFEEECLDELKRQHLSQPGPSAYAEKLEEKNTYSMSPRLKAFSDWLLKVMMSGNLEAVFPAATREYARNIEELVRDASFQAAYSRRNELDMLPRVANYFLDRAVEISRADYEPSNMDILYAEGITPSNGVASMEFSFPVSNMDTFNEPVEQFEYSSSNKYQLIRVDSSSLGRNCKWLGMFEDVDMVIFCVSLTDYDEYYVDSEGVYMNKMVAHRKFMENIVLHPSFAHKDFLLLLNKLDILDEKLERAPLSECEWFHDFNPVVSNGSSNPSLAQRAYHYIAVKFKRMFEDLTAQKLYVSPVTGLESNSVDEALKYSGEILRWEEDKPRVCRNEFSSESIEASSSS